ncbi:MAG TPA: helix-hairpin-helix domain-containing protein [Geothrix sp.]|nr:helix-hairpin-helix domain-containing protein [Geothrix sp.]
MTTRIPNLMPTALLLALGLALPLVAQKAGAQEAATPKPAPAPNAAPAKAPEASAKPAAAKAKAKASAVEPRTKGKLKPVDINHADPNEISFMLGIDAALAAKVVANRPYKTKAELVVKNVFTMELYQKLKNRVAAK